MQETVRILGIDPGLRHTGWGLIDKQGMKLNWVAHGVIRPPTDISMAERLAAIAGEITDVVDDYSPHIPGIEETFVNMNPKTTLLLGQARGAAMAGLALVGIPVAEFAAKKIKQSVVGTGNADKDQVAFMIKRLLPKAGNVTADAADALAVAITTGHHAEPKSYRKSA